MEDIQCSSVEWFLSGNLIESNKVQANSKSVFYPAGPFPQLLQRCWSRGQMVYRIETPVACISSSCFLKSACWCMGTE